MRVLDKLTAFWARSRLTQFANGQRRPAAVQAEVLRAILRQARDTEWGRRHGFAALAGPEDFRRAVPLTPYETAAPEWHRAFAGDGDVAWPGHVRYFAMSSGTTAGNKYLPVTWDALRANRRAGALLLAMLVQRFGPEVVTGGKFLYLGGSTTLSPRGQCLTGDASGIATRHIPRLARRRHLPTAETAAITNWEEKIGRIVATCAAADVRVLSACPSWAALLFKELLDHGTPQGEPVWPGLRCFVSFGMAFEPYRTAFAKYLARPVPVVETYSSSEGGMTAIQEEEGGPLRLIIDNGVFFEFIPEEEADSAAPHRYHIGEVETGRNYALVLSTNGGIWAYPLGDVVRFISLDPPRIVFAGRTRISLNAFGEHVTLEMLENAMAAAAKQTGAVVADYTVLPLYPSPETPRPRHRWMAAFDVEPADPARFMETVDATLRAASEDYDTHRRGDYGMTMPELVRLPADSFVRWMRERGQLGGQHKVPRVLRSAEQAEALLAAARR